VEGAGYVVLAQLLSFLSYADVLAGQTTLRALSVSGSGLSTCTLAKLTCEGILIGNPIGGVIVERSWGGLQGFCGATLVTSAAFIILTRLKVVGVSLTRKT